MIEFEVKALVPPDRLEAVRAALGEASAIEEHADLYFQHPCRDLVATDEAVRLSRRGGKADLTYKGPKLDSRTKARREVVVPLAGEAEARAFLEATGFRLAAEVRKRRHHHRLAGWEVALDEVPGLGWFVELERQVPEGADTAQAERDAMALLAAWGLASTERRSYLEMLEALRRRG